MYCKILDNSVLQYIANVLKSDKVLVPSKIESIFLFQIKYLSFLFVLGAPIMMYEMMPCHFNILYFLQYNTVVLFLLLSKDAYAFLSFFCHCCCESSTWLLIRCKKWADAVYTALKVRANGGRSQLTIRKG